MGMNTVSDRPSVGVHVVTGATAGLGLETAAGLAEQGLHVVIAGRGSERLAAARASILERCPGASLDVIAVDLASLDSVRAAAAQLRERYTSIEVLVNNAGVMYTPLERTAEGFELQFGVNCLGHFEWTKLLMPLLLADDGARVVNVASHAHRANGIDLADPNWERRPYDKFVAYAAAKTANILFTVGLEQRFAGRGVHAFAVHPGTVNTSLGRYMSRDDMRHLKSLVAARAGVEIGATPPPIAYASVRDGARTSVWAATTADLVDRGGLYLADCVVVQAAAHATDPIAADELWAMSEQLCGPWGAQRSGDA
ncbi:NAD(P)-dependent dehydrogenase (short-subunit alcohol dehydrogenase family) [Rhodococcus sp. UYP5]